MNKYWKYGLIAYAILGPIMGWFIAPMNGGRTFWNVLMCGYVYPLGVVATGLVMWIAMPQSGKDKK